MPGCEWAWQHGLELGQLIRNHIPEEHLLSPSSQMERAPQLNVGTSQAPLSPFYARVVADLVLRRSWQSDTGDVSSLELPPLYLHSIHQPTLDF